MPRHRVRTLLLVITAVSLTTLATVGAANAMRWPATAVAVVDVDRVFRDIDEARALVAENETAAEQVRERLAQIDEEIKQIQSDLEMTNRTSAAYMDKLSVYEQKTLEKRVFAEFQQNRMLRLRAVQYEQLYQSMSESLERVGRTNGIDLILYKEPAPSFSRSQPETVPQQIKLRKYLWSTDELDITDQVITDMNLQFKNRAGSAAR